MEAEEEIRAQRHDFIKEYYKMAVADLDRHLKAGWQSIVVLAGGGTILAAGHEGKIGLPIATAIALASAVWGALTTIDANYWSLRAIGFLANVEAVYFSVEDRKSFNPYIGFHPEYKFLDSLRYMFWLCIFFGLASVTCLAWEVTRFYPTLGAIWLKLRGMPAIPFFLWMLPGGVLIGGAIWLFRVWKNRMVNYIEFSAKSPGPGVREKTEDIRFVTLLQPKGTPSPSLEASPQLELVKKLEKSAEAWKSAAPYVYGLGGVAILTFLYFWISKL